MEELKNIEKIRQKKQKTEGDEETPEAVEDKVEGLACWELKTYC